MNRKIAITVAAGLAAIGSATMGLAVTSAAGAATPPAATSSSTGGQGTVHAVRAWLRDHRRRVVRAVVVVSAGAINISPSSLVGALRSGQSIADVANAHGVSPQTVINALVSKGDAEVSTLLSEGKLTSTQATKIENALPTWAGKIVDHVFGQHAATAPAA